MTGGQEKPSIFTFHRSVLKVYRDFILSFVRIKDDGILGYVRKEVLSEKGIFPEPLVQLSPGYAPGKTVEELVKEGLLHEELAGIFPGWRLHRHQEEAIRKVVEEGRGFVLTSGTGSGKSLTYFIPLIHFALKYPHVAPLGLVVYPLNALVNSQLNFLLERKREYEKRTGKPFPIRFSRYTGETPDEERNQIRKDPPHIILTNYVMAEYLILRPEDRELLSRPSQEAPFLLVFDELHTYRGRQGADVALLIRRLKARQPQERRIIPIGTSATMVAGKGMGSMDRKAKVAEFAKVFFGHPFSPSDVVEETLKPTTSEGEPTSEELVQGLGEALPEDPEAFLRHPLVRFVEYGLGLEREGEALRRRVPRPLGELAEELSSHTELPLEKAKARLEEVLVKGSALKDHRGKPLLAFKLHQFIRQSPPLYATLHQDSSQRKITIKEAEVLGGEDYYPLRFCRRCGQVYYEVVHKDGAYHNPLFFPEEDAGYLTPWPDPKEEIPIPEELQGKKGVPHPKLVFVDPKGGKAVEEGAGLPFLYQPAPLRYCVGCNTVYDPRTKEHTKLAYLSAEGRTSSTTILATALLQEYPRYLQNRGKLLTFTDNRQDAALQAGHFNDFVRTVALRAALYSALKKAEEEAEGRDGFQGLTLREATERMVEVLGLEPKDYLKDPNVAPNTSMDREAKRMLKDTIRYRLLQDQTIRRRFTLVGLEEVGLLTCHYREVDWVFSEGGDSSATPLEEARKALLESLREAIPSLKKDVGDEDILDEVRNFLDYIRRRGAITGQGLKQYAEAWKEFSEKARNALNETWAPDEESDTALYPSVVHAEPGKGGVAFTPRGHLGRYFRDRFGFREEDYRNFLEVLAKRGILERKGEGYALSEEAFRFKAGDGEPKHNPILLRTRVRPSDNEFCKELYRRGVDRSFLDLEAREHTGQVVDREERELRERRFRYTEVDQKTLPQGTKPLPYLVCSPTLELGVDIADLDLVHLRNIPPTPANYAQRAGRAGRQGQAGLVLAYSAHGSHHDQYYFRHREEMVAGAVRAPGIDLANEDLLRSHIYAEWLVATGLSLGHTIRAVLNIPEGDHPSKEDYSLRSEVQGRIHLDDAKEKELITLLQRIFQGDREALTKAGIPLDESWLKEVIEEAPTRFDRAFDRWRELYQGAKERRERAHRQLEKVHGEERKRMEDLRSEAERQMNLLLQEGVRREEGDFYPYRYLATEGFLPGYGFPALPVRAWVPRKEEGEFIARPRKLAIGEYAPETAFYHEGVRWRFARFLPGGSLKERVSHKKICALCGGLLEENDPKCPQCNSEATSNLITLLEMPNVAYVRDRRIDTDEEERSMSALLLRVTFRHEGGRKVKAYWTKNGEDLLEMEYLPATDIYILNEGRKRNPGPYVVNLNTGEVVSLDEGKGKKGRKEKGNEGQGEPVRQPVYLYVRFTRNALRIRPVVNLKKLMEEEKENKESVAKEGEDSLWKSLGYALKRGIEALYELEESELALEIPGTNEGRSFLFYEDAEGSLGILRRLVEDPKALSQVMDTALEILHFKGVEDGFQNANTECLKACYECLLSYHNQTEVAHLNRFKAYGLLKALLGGTLRSLKGDAGGRERRFKELYARLEQDGRSSQTERQFLTFLYEKGYPLPDDVQYRVDQASTVVDFYYAKGSLDPEKPVALYLDGPHHETERQRILDEEKRKALFGLGYRVLVVHEKEEAWKEELERSGVKPVV